MLDLVSAGTDTVDDAGARRFAADSLNGSKDDAKSRDLGSRRWAAIAAAVVAASRWSVVRIAARVDLTGPG